MSKIKTKFIEVPESQSDKIMVADGNGGILYIDSPMKGEVEIVTVNNTHITNKAVFTSKTISEEYLYYTIVEINGSPTQSFNKDFTILNDSHGDRKKISWEGLLLDGVISEGDVITITYYHSDLKEETMETQMFTLSEININNKYVEVLYEIKNVRETMFIIANGPTQDYEHDFEVLPAADGKLKRISWAGRSIETRFDQGDVIYIKYRR